MSRPISQRRTGTQSLGRALVLLRELASRGQFGWALGDLAARCDLDKGTAHRILAHLKRERMVQQRAGDRHYVPGALMFELGLALQGHAALVHACERPLEALARRLGCVAFLYVRSGADYVCAVRAGALPPKALSIDIGTRRPLLTSAGGIAILIALPREEARAIVDANAATVSRAGGLSVTALKRMWRESERRGIGANEQDVVPGWNAYAVAMRDGLGVPFASIMVVGNAREFSLARRPELVALLEAEAEALGREAARLLPGGY
jgi:DNA-binding IclR family transcriptional regulator